MRDIIDTARALIRALIALPAEVRALRAELAAPTWGANASSTINWNPMLPSVQVTGGSFGPGRICDTCHTFVPAGAWHTCTSAGGRGPSVGF